MKLDLLTNATVVDDAIRFASSKSNKSAKSSNGESNEPDYGEDKDQLEEARDITTNQVF